MNSFNEYTEKIDKIKEGLTAPLVGVIKYINNETINENFFGNKENITQNNIDNFLSDIDDRLLEIKKTKNELANSNISGVEKKFLLSSLNATGLKYIMFKRSVYLEAEKGGYKLDDIKRLELLKEVNKIQDILYGPECSSMEDEKNTVLKNLDDLYIKNKQELSELEKEEFTNFIKKINYTRKNINGKSEDKINKKSILEETYLSTEKFTELLTAILDIYQGLEGWSISIEDVGNFSVNEHDKIIKCPMSKITKTSLKRLFELIDHEIGVHAFRGHNTSKTTKVKGEGYVAMEEGFAGIAEELFDSNLDEIEPKPGIGHIIGFIAENFNFEEALPIVEIYLKLSNPQWEASEIKTTAKTRLMRAKRFVSLKLKGANRKDVSYLRGEVQVGNYLKSANVDEKKSFIQDFYYSKLAFEDQGLVEEFRNTLNIDEKELEYPLWLGKILYKKMSGEKIFLDKLKEEDFRFNNIEKISMNTKRKIIDILNNLKP